MIRQRIPTMASIAGWMLFAFSFTFGQQKNLPEVQSQLNSAQSTATSPQQTLVDINTITGWIRGNGLHWADAGGSWNGTFPKGTAGFIFAEGIVWGGKVNDGLPKILRVGGNWFRTGCSAGQILPGGIREPDNAETVRPYRVRRDWETADLRDDAANFFNKQLSQVTDAEVDQIRTQYEIDLDTWPWRKGAPYEDRNGNGVYEPDIDIPGFPGADQTVWTVYNDLDETKTLTFFNSDPIGFEVQETSWAYERTDPLANIIFKRVRIIYKGTRTTPANATIDSMYIVQFADPDLGFYADDFVGSDTTLSLGFAYNSTTVDGVYFKRFGLPPPAGGFDFLQGPIVPALPTDSALFVDFKYRKGYKNLPMTAFTFFSFPGSRVDPPPSGPGTATGTWYNLMAGFEPRPEYPARVPLYDHLGNVTKFELTGDPVRGTGDLDGKPTAANTRRFLAGDRRFVMSTGPFTMKRGDTQEIVVALVAGLGADYLSSVSVMKYSDRFAQNAYDNRFDIPKFPAPIVSVAELDKEIVLNWGQDLERVKQVEDTLKRGGYSFEGYNVYQLPNATATLQQAKKIKTFDLINNITVIVDEVLDEQTAVIVTKPVQVGSNSGIQRYLKITKDEIRNSPLVNGQQYYFAVTAYSYNGSPAAPSHSLESSHIVKLSVAQSSKPGVRYPKNFGDTLTTTHLSGVGTGKVIVSVIDQSSLTGDTYNLTFAGTAESKTYSLRNETKGQTIYSGGKNLGELFGGTPYDYPLVDGMLIAVTDVPFGLRADWIDGTKWLDGFRFRDEVGNVHPSSGFNGGVLPGAYGSNYLAQYKPVFSPNSSYPIEIRFSTTINQKAYRLRRTGPGTEYVVQPTNPFADVPFTVLDMRNPQSPRQLTVSWRDNNNNSRWDPPVGGDGVEVIFIYDKTYSPNGDQFTSNLNDATVGAKADIVCLCSFQVLAGHTLSESDGKIVVAVNFPFDSRDVFTFMSPAKLVNTDLAKEDVKKINVFPNPYFGFNSRETSRLNKYVTFNHLPAKAIIRIFNMAGVLLKVIEKGDASQFKTWDLRNQNNLPVASGVYIVHIEMPDLGTTKILKLALVQEEQVLPVY